MADATAPFCMKDPFLGTKEIFDYKFLIELIKPLIIPVKIISGFFYLSKFKPVECYKLWTVEVCWQSGSWHARPSPAVQAEGS
ncbi:Uncharacterised protein [Lacrimispora sphenoides]|uniref:Uncharacterized protein n=1 Tax=Lacrimispora sphenoides JCM 1415 TaxID=1297793 RepID=A0ABY1CEC0_9FIRM|nr:hypothetical protein SAMN02745906_3584 [[Clostridium] sphenoides JCM 1415]SUY52892.1 Uncharacterised protein [Lacrimispora sphenoides]